MESAALSDSGRKCVFVASLTAAFIIPFAGSALNLAIPQIASKFGLNSQSANWVVTIYVLAAAVALVPFGRVADLVGRARVFLAGISAFTVASFLCALSPSPTILLVCRALQGTAGACIFGTATALLISAYPASQRGRVLGLNVAAVYTGLSVGPVAGGFLTQYAGWRGVFFAIALLGLPGSLLARRIPGEKPDDRVRFDVLSIGLYAVGLAGVMHGLASMRTLTAAPAIALTGALLLAGFVVRQFRTPAPLVKLSLFGNPVFAFSNLAALIHYSATFANGYLVSLYLQVVKGISPQRAGLVLLVQPILMAALSPISGRVSDRIQPRMLASAGMAITCVGLALFAALGATTAMAVVVVNLAIIGVGFALFSSPNTNAVMSSIDRCDYGVGASILGTMRLLGQAISMVLVNLFFSMRLGDRPLTPEHSKLLLQSTDLAYVFFAVLCAIGIASSLARGRLRR